MLILKCLIVFCYFLTQCYSKKFYPVKNEDVWLKTRVDHLFGMCGDTNMDTKKRVQNLELFWRDHQKTAEFEIGYLVFTITDRYRQMVDRYNTSETLRTTYYETELLIFLIEVEVFYFDCNHLINMLHEVERKYKQDDDTDAEATSARNTKPVYVSRTTPKRPKFHLTRYLEQALALKKYRNIRPPWGNFPLDYGWWVPLP